MQDVIIVGGGHAGIEATLAVARMGMKSLLISSNLDNIGSLPCNPSIGGPAKGIVVREIDALGGQMGKTADATYLQMKMLNTAKGPGVQSLRAQADKIDYPKMMLDILKKEPNVTLLEAMVEDLIIIDNKVSGVILEDGTKLESKAVILTTGTYLKSRVLVGDQITHVGPDNQRQSLYLSDKLKERGFTILRLKTGTPPRIKKDSIDYSKTEIQYGTNANLAFSFETNLFIPLEEQEPCYLTYTTPLTHQLINENLHLSSMYSGIVEGIGPRYCPSIEDKVVRFSDKERHQIFLEPESRHLDSIYIQGFSTSLPHHIQYQMIRSLPGLEQCEVLKYAYAIEYDAIDPTQLWPTLETKLLKNLYTAGQINGTSGYEEAAGQGLIAGINAVRSIEKEKPLILRRDEAYIGVLIDDLVTKGTKEPYRLLTSRAEYRLLLRHDNADQRLMKYGYDVGLVSDDRYHRFEVKIDQINDEIDRLKTIRFTPKHEINNLLEELGTAKLTEGISAKELIQRPECNYRALLPYLDEYPILSDEQMDQIDIQIKYQGYIEKTLRQVEKQLKMDEKEIPSNIDYQDIINLSLEAKQKLSNIKPITIGQASRISGINPADIAVLLIYLKQHYKETD